MPSKSPIEGKCGAKLRNSEKRFGSAMYCTNPPEPQRNRCKFHGGRSPRGIESPNYKGRGWSKDLPTRLMDRFKTALEDHDLTSLQAEIALLDSRLGEMLAALDDSETLEKWMLLREFSEATHHALEAENFGELKELLDNMGATIDAALADYKQWHAIYDLVDNRRRLVDTERKREEFLAGTMTTRQAMAFVQALQTAIVEEISDVDVRRRLGVRIRFLLGEGHDPETEGEYQKLSLARPSELRRREANAIKAEVESAAVEGQDYEIEEEPNEPAG
jgi:hypothetical protein